MSATISPPVPGVTTRDETQSTDALSNQDENGTRVGHPFTEHLAAIAERTVVFSPVQAAESAWDAALCAAQARCFDEHGQVRSAGEIMDILSKLHSWHAQPEDRPC